MNVEVAICTWNRARLLDQTLDRLCAIDKSDCDSLRLIVVDNNSSDETASVIERYGSRLDVCGLEEKQPGQVPARNRAIEAAQGDLLLWIDDDVIVGNGWLRAYVDAATNQSDVSFWGGPIDPKFEQVQPKWIDENWEKLSGCFACRKLGDTPFQFSKQKLPYGANFAIRTDVQKQFPFQSGLGRTKTVVSGEDELDLFRRLLEDDHQGRWVPSARIEHLIDASRSTTAFVGKYFVGQGQALVAKGEAWTTSVEKMEREMKHELFWFRVKRYFAKSDVWLSHLIRGSLAAGQAAALRSDPK